MLWALTMAYLPGKLFNNPTIYSYYPQLSRKKIDKNVILAFYKGIKIAPGASESKSWDEDSYKIFDPSIKPNGTIDIPVNFRSLTNYSASLAHKVLTYFNSVSIPPPSHFRRITVLFPTPSL